MSGLRHYLLYRFNFSYYAQYQWRFACAALRLGETTWAGYFQLRIDPVAPSCNRTMDIDTELARLVAQSKAADDLDLLAEDVDEGALRQSLLSAQAQCAERFAQYEDASKRLTFGVKVFRAIELSVAQFGEFGLVAQRIMLAVLVLICGLTALFRRHHIALRPMETEMDHRVAAIGQAIASGILFYSVYSFKEVAFNSGVAVSGQHAALHYLWILGFAAILILSIYQLLLFLKMPKQAEVLARRCWLCLVRHHVHDFWQLFYLGWAQCWHRYLFKSNDGFRSCFKRRPLRLDWYAAKAHRAYRENI